MPTSHTSILRLFLPDTIIANFEFKSVIQDEEAFQFELEELNSPPEEWGSLKVHSNGFFPQIQVQDFPVRGHKVYYHIRPRRWQEVDTGKVIYRDWTLIEKGTRMTGEFAAFLKEISQYSAE